MSSAALQAALHQPTTLASSPNSIPSPSSRQYASSRPSPAQEPYNAHQSNTASPSSRRPPSRKTSGTGGPSPSYHDSISTPAERGVTLTGTSEPRSPHYDSYANMPPVAPPRTSSTQQNAGGRRSNYQTDKAPTSARHGQTESPRSGSRSDTNGATEAPRSKRTASIHVPQEPSSRTSTSRDGRAAEAALPIRPHKTPTSKPSGDAGENLIQAMSNSDDPNARQVRADYHSSPSHEVDEAAPAPAVGTHHEERRGGRSRHDHSRSHKGTSKFGDFILGNTIGEGEFGKVKLGWKQDSQVQVAIKLIKRDTVGSNPSRLAKIRREVTILRGIHHPNIVRLIDMVETDRYIGIILEYASGGELFDYILNHRYLKDNSARRLFSQLISGVGYLHKKGIVHRDLKLENLLLDRNRNIIITDFGFANTFDSNEELAEEEELHLTDRDFVKRSGLDRVKPNGMRKGDLMQTSCGSPCYAAPELVVSDSLYTGRKVDVWSCGVILYAMLAGYLPFDDDPANPEGDNINLLYKYIVTTPLTFPEYVTPHARDLLRRILVPNPRKRADLFEVARHSWLSEYAHVVEFITSSTTLPSDVQNSQPSPEDYADAPNVTRSSSVRDGGRHKAAHPTSAVGGLAKAHGKIDQDAESPRTPKDAKRRTVQVEYVAPTTQTQRGADVSSPSSQGQSARTASGTQGRTSPKDKPLPQDPPVSRDGYARPGQSSQSRRPPSAHRNANNSRPARDGRSHSDNAYYAGTSTATRPQTGGSIQSAASGNLQSRGNYGQPAPPAVADMNAQGRIQQPVDVENEGVARPTTGLPPKVARLAGIQNEAPSGEVRGHKRSNTIGDIGSKLLGRNGSVFGRKKQPEMQGEKTKKYPPVSMTGPLVGDEAGPRPSMDSRTSRRSFSLGIGRKRSGSMTGSQGSKEKPDRRRFSLLPASFSLKAIGLGKDYGPPPSETDSRPDLPIQNPRNDPPRSFTAHGDARGSTPFFDGPNESDPRQGNARSNTHQRYASVQLDNRNRTAIPAYIQSGSHLNTGSDSSVDMRRPPTEPQLGQYQHGFSESEGYDGRRIGTGRSNRGVLQKGNRRFADAYDDDYRGHEGSSGAAKRVMDFFRRRGKARGGEDR